MLCIATGEKSSCLRELTLLKVLMREPRLYAHRIVRTRLGACARIRHETGGSFHRTIAKENRRSTADSYSALRRLHNSRVTIKFWQLSWKLAGGDKAGEDLATCLLGSPPKVTTVLLFPGCAQ